MKINKIIKDKWPDTNTIGKEEIKAANKVLKSGNLSGFRASPDKSFYGGPEVLRLEKNWSKLFKVKHSISFNSWTSGLIASVGALGIEPGDEVICPPITMEATSTCLLFYGAIPIFADINPLTLCIDVKEIEKKITKKTKAIIVVHIFGQPCDMQSIMILAKKYNLKVLEDAAQSPLGKYKNKYLGTIGDIGGFSLNYHKTIQCGEGGVVTTNDDDLAFRMKLIRNHGESTIDKLNTAIHGNIFGGNFRMNEIEAAIANEQLKKLKFLTKYRKDQAKYLIKNLKKFKFLQLPVEDTDGSEHVFYFFVILFHKKNINISREAFHKLCNDYGLEIRKDYVNPVYFNSLYINKKIYPKNNKFMKNYNYYKGLCPVAEDILANKILFGKFCRWPLKKTHLNKIIKVFNTIQDKHID